MHTKALMIPIISALILFNGSAFAEDVGMRTSGVVSHGDWSHMAIVDATRFMSFDAFWGSTGTEYIVDTAKANGMTRLYWRMFGGARAYYNSQLDEDGDGVNDVIIQNNYYIMPIEREYDRGHFLIVDVSDTYHEIRLPDSNASAVMPVTYELHFKMENLDGNAGVINFTLRFADMNDQHWDLHIMGDGSLRNADGSSQMAFDPVTYYHYYRFVCTSSSDVKAIIDLDPAKEIPLIAEQGEGGGYFSLISGASPIPFMRVDICSVASGAHVPPAKLPDEDWDRLKSNYGEYPGWYQTLWGYDWVNQDAPHRFSVGTIAGDEHQRADYQYAYSNDTARWGEGEGELSYAIKYGQEQGLEMYAWFSLGEENHYGHGPISRYATLHPEHLEVDKYGIPWKARLSFAFPEVREYKMSIVREIVERCNPDGLFLDFNRRGLKDPFLPTSGEPVRDSDGVCIFGFDSQMISDYQAEYGVDPTTLPNYDESWIQFRCDNSWTRFLRDIKAEFPDLPVVPMIYYYDSATARRADLFDWEMWLEDGLVDGISFLLNREESWMTGTGWNDRPNPVEWAADIMQARKEEINGRADCIGGIYCYGITPDDVDNNTIQTYIGGADELMWWETQPMEYSGGYGGAAWERVHILSDLLYSDESIAVDADDSVTIYWRAKAGKYYKVLYSDDPGSGWNVVVGKESITGSNQVMNWTDDGSVVTPAIAAAPRRFYKVEEYDSGTVDLDYTAEVTYHFDETSGSVADDASENNRDGVVYDSGVPQWGAGKFGNALYFDGIADNTTRVIVSESLAAGPYQLTIEAWIKLDTKTKSLDIAWQGGYIYFRIDGAGKLEGLIFDGQNRKVYGSTVIPSGEWVHVALVYDGINSTREVKLFVNGVEDGYLPYSGAYGVVGGGSYIIIVGDNGWTYTWALNREFKGWMDDFRITYDALY
jgi:Concanavalin A-like lectin/glucanases superfamily/Glycosyl hydrolase-like 10